MLRVYYQRNNAVQKVQTLSQLETLEGLIWIDLQNPTSDEIKDVESHFEFKFQSRQEQLEIESSSRYFETDDEIIANNNFLIRRNGTQLVQTASYTYSLGTNSCFQIGYRHTDRSYSDVALNAYIAEIVYYNSQLGTTNQQQVEGYLAWKWGIQGSLPAGHPYSGASP